MALLRMHTWILTFLFCLAGTVSGFCATSTNRDLSEFFGRREGCFVFYDTQADSYIRYNSKGCAERFSPCSTFKIANSLIALDTGVVTGPEFSLKWDGVAHPIAPWNQDHTLRSAMSNSVLWFYQEIARRIGPIRMADHVLRFNYGNGDTSGGITNFWLESTLLISADEQVAFLRRLWTDSLPVSKAAQRTTRELMELGRSQDGRTFFGKTGTGGDAKADIARLGWFVGCVTKGERTFLFATRITGEPDASGRQARKITEAILKSLQI
ncbi:MAG: class D beta-lactamase [Akkermansiaceae bacterium]|nr:class D beta-lactamase [Verrucomicrobiales bacterium]